MTSPRARDDAGFVAPFTVAVAVAMIWLLAIVLDGGRWMRAQSNIFGVAAAAARTATQQIDEAAVLRGELQLDEAAAEQAAYDYLAARDLTGTVTVDGLEVTVTAHDTVDFQLLPIGTATIEETATARATQERAN
jgi:Flp pilus assembly protein TadG